MTNPGEWQFIGNHKIRVEGDIVNSVWDGPSTLAEIQAYHVVLERVIAERGRAFTLIDMRKAHRPPPDGREWITTWSESHELAAVACFGASFTVRTFATLLLRAIRLVKRPGGVMAFFETEAQARAFLAAERARLEARDTACSSLLKGQGRPAKYAHPTGGERLDRARGRQSAIVRPVSGPGSSRRRQKGRHTGMRVGICGYPGSGKSTVFSALAPGGRTDRDIAFGNIKVPDSRVDSLAAIFKPKKTTYAEITFVDVGGTGGGARAGGAFPPEVLQGMRNADLLVHVVRGFENPSLPTRPDPGRDERLFNDELLLLDMGILEKRGERFKKEAKKGPEVDVNKKCLEHLEKGEALRTLTLAEEEQRALGPGIQLLSATPLITLYNLSEEAWADPNSKSLRDTKEGGASVSLAICGSIEAEIAALPPEEQKDFLEGLGLGEPARNAFIRAAYRLLDLISFLTAGPDECRAWPIRRGTVARKAAGKVHSDIERGFIRAEIYRPEDLKVAGTEAALKAQGKIHVEGKEYVMQDGDVVNFRFNV